jgi:signal transduction histidine kinase
MQQTNETAAAGGAERKRVEAVLETLATLRSQGESVAEVAHDARNMVTALGLYCDLLEEPGVLATPFTHYGNELRLVAAASRRLVEKLVALDTNFDADFDSNSDQTPDASFYSRFNGRPGAKSVARPGATPAASPVTGPDMSVDAGHAASLRTSAKLKEASRPIDAIGPGRSGLTSAVGNLLERGWPGNIRHDTPGRWDPMPAVAIDNLAAELLANRNLLATLAGPTIALTIDAEGGSRPVQLTGEDLTRVLVNLVKNAAEALPVGGRIRIGLRERPVSAETAETLALTIEDNGPGIPESALEDIFASGYTTRAKELEANRGWPATHRGLGLSITRSIVEAAGGRILASNRAGAGACFEIELPVRKSGY